MSLEVEVSGCGDGVGVGVGVTVGEGEDVGAASAEYGKSPQASGTSRDVGGHARTPAALLLAS